MRFESFQWGCSRCVSSQFKRQLLERSATLLHEKSTNRGRSGKRNFGDLDAAPQSATYGASGHQRPRFITHFSQSSRPAAFSLSPLSMVTTLTTPGGIPTRSQRTHMARADKGVSAGALMTTVQPAARAGAILRVIMALGKFLYNEAMSMLILK